MKFHATVLREGKTATGIEIPSQVLEALGGGGRPLIKVTINGATYRTAVGYMAGKSMIPLSAENRALTGAAGGDHVEVEVELDLEKREVEVPADFAAALAAQPLAQKAFEALTSSGKKRHVVSIEGAKTDETRQRRIVKAIAELAAGL
jgi:hypothetical protein